MALPPTSTDTPESLLRAYVESGDPEAVGRLFDLTSLALFRLALTLTRDAGKAEDALQETFLAALAHPEAFEQGRPVLPWLTGILRRKIGRQRRDAGRVPDPERLSIPTPPDDPAARAESREERERVRAAIEDLPEPYREVALLRWCYGLEPAEIAHVRSEPPGTVRSLLHRAARKLGTAICVSSALFAADAGHGLAAVRGRVLEAAAQSAPVPPAGAAVASAAIVTEGLLMGTTPKIFAALLVLIAGGLGVWSLLNQTAEPLDPKTPEDAAEAGIPPIHVRAPGETGSVGPRLPAPVDLAAADRDHDLHGRVTDVRGEPIGGAVLTLREYPWRRTRVLNHAAGASPETAAESRTAADGTFSFRLRRGALVDLEVEARGFVSRTIPSAQAGERLLIRLIRGGVDLTVLVLGTDGRAVPGASVRVFTLSNEPAAVVNRTAFSDDEGRARFPGIMPSLPLQADAGKAGFGDPAWVPFTSLESGAHTVTVRLPAGRVLSGTITDATTGKPVAGAMIGTGRDLQDAVRSGPDGTYRLSGWTGATTRRIQVTAAGYGRASRAVGELQVVDVALEPGDSVVGRLVDAGGTAISGARVTAISYGRSGTPHALSFGHDTSDEEGRFRVTGLRHDMVHTLVVLREGYGRTLVDFPPAPDGPGTVDLGDVLVHAGYAVEGVVRDADGDPAPWIAVTLLGANADRDRLRNLPSPEFSLGKTERRRTDDLGRFRFPDLAPGTYTITAEPPRAPHCSTIVRILSSNVLDAEIRLSRGRRVTVTVLGPDGEPLPGVMVVAGISGSRPVNGRTDGRGTCVLTFGSVGRVHLAAWGRGAPSTADLVPPPARILAPDETRAVFRFGRGRLVRARVLDVAGDPVPGILVEIHTGEALPTLAATDGDGRIAWKSPAADPVDLIVTGHVQSGRHPGRLPLRGEARRVVPGEPELTIRCREVARDRTLTVRVTDPAGRPFEGVSVSVWGSSRRDPRHVSGAAGTVRLTGLPAEETRIVVYPASGRLRRDWFPPVPVRIVPAGQTVEMRFRAGVEVTGTLTDRDGAGIVGARVSALLGERALSRGETEAGGRFTLFVPEGTSRFDIKADWDSDDAGVGRTSVSGVTPGRDVRLTAD